MHWRLNQISVWKEEFPLREVKQKLTHGVILQRIAKSRELTCFY